jgi:apolipoprotein N-acyltransferase
MNKIHIKDIGAAALSGILTALAFPKFQLIFFAWISLIPLLNIILRKKPRQSFLLGLLSGLVFYAVLLYWIPAVPQHYGNLSPIISFLIFLVLILFLSLFWGFFALVSSYIKDRFPFGIFYLFPFLWISFEYLITHLLTGFPWGVIGYSQQPNVYFLQTATITGVYGISFILISFQSLFLCSLSLKRRSPFFSILALVLLLHVAGFLSIKDTEKNEEPFKASVIQGNISSDIYWNNITEDEKRALFDRHINLSYQSYKAGASLIIWPEFTVPLCFSCPYGLYQEFRKELNEFVMDTGCTLVFGTNEIQPSTKFTLYYNASLTLKPDLTYSQYNKMHLVPFGEYTPYKKIFSFIESMTHAIGEISPGKEHLLHDFQGNPFGTPICYEIIFPDLVRKFTKKGALFLVTITNDGWYGTSAAPFQHFAMSVFRAVENRRYLLRAATTGISGFIDPYGRVISKTQMETQTFLTSDIYIKKTQTFYSLHGDVLPYISLTLSALFLILAILKRRYERNKIFKDNSIRPSTSN